MNTNKMVEAINNVEDKYLDEAANYKPKKKKIHPALMGFAAMAACFALVLGSGVLKNKDKAGTTNPVGMDLPVDVDDVMDSIVSIDINPSIELTVNKHDKVLSAVALNADAEVVLDGMDLKNVDLGIALNALMGSLLKNGYLDEVYNAVNVCVENDDTERASELGEKVTGEISSIFDENDLIGGVNTQYYSRNDEAKKLADSYGVSVGKLRLAQKISASMGIALDVAVTFSISELWDLLDAESVTLITKEEALTIAAKDAKVETSVLALVSVKIQESEGVFTYVIKFIVGENKQYNYKIDAIDGSILSCEFEYNVKVETPTLSPTATVTSTPTPTVTSTPEATVTPTVTVAPTATVAPTVTVAPTATVTPTPTLTPTPTPEPVKEITKNAALMVAYNDAGVETQDVKLTKLEHKSKEKEYHIEFSVGLYDYMYVICSVDGSVLQRTLVDHTITEDTEEKLPNSVLTIEEALALALQEAGVESESLTMCDIKYTSNKKGAEYKVHFHVDKAHYEYNVNAVTGEIAEKAHPAPEKPAGPLKPHEKEETAKPTPIPPHEKEKAEKPTPVPPHEKVEAKPVGPKDTKVTITFEEQTE